MKKILPFLVILILSSCSTQQAKDILTKLFFDKNEEEVDTNSFNEEIPITDMSFIKTSWCDSVKYQPIKSRLQWCKINYSCEYPQNDGSVASLCILNWICEKFGDKKHEYYNNIPKLLSTKGAELLKSIKKSYKNDYPEYMSSESESEFTWTSKVSVKRIFENDTCVTLSLCLIEDVGLVSIAKERETFTFDKRTGHQYGFDLLDKYNKESLNSLLIEDFKKEYGTTSTEEIIKTLNIDRNTFYNNIPLPATTPYILRDSIVLIYKPYEFKKLRNAPIVKIPLEKSNSVTGKNYQFDEEGDITDIPYSGLILDFGAGALYDGNRNVIQDNLIFRDTDTIHIMFGMMVGENKGGWCQLDRIWLGDAYRVRVENNGDHTNLGDPGEEFYENFSLPKSPTGDYWIPLSAIPELTTLGIGGIWFCLREEPSFVSKIKYSSFQPTSFEVLDLKEGWVKVGIIEYLPDKDGNYHGKKKNIEGWIPIVHTCSNPVTTCN